MEEIERPREGILNSQKKLQNLSSDNFLFVICQTSIISVDLNVQN